MFITPQICSAQCTDYCFPNQYGLSVPITEVRTSIYDYVYLIRKMLKCGMVRIFHTLQFCTVCVWQYIMEWMPLKVRTLIAWVNGVFLGNIQICFARNGAVYPAPMLGLGKCVFFHICQIYPRIILQCRSVDCSFKTEVHSMQHFHLQEMVDPPASL